MRHRAGVSMIELIVVMSACTALLTLTGVLMQRAMRTQSQSRSHVDVERTSMRLGNQFRQDVHEARTAAVSGAKQGEAAFLRLEFEGGRTAAYSWVPSGIERVETAANRPAWRESFSFPALDEVAVEEQAEPRRLILTLIAGPGDRAVEGGKFSVPAVPVSLRAEATLGRSLRYITQVATQEAAR